MTKKMNWTIKKIDDDLLPVIRRLNETKVKARVFLNKTNHLQCLINIFFIDSKNY
jgi:hypothetical protein